MSCRCAHAIQPSSQPPHPVPSTYQPTCPAARPPLLPARLQTLNTGSLKWATALFFGYLYMVASWGGYSFIANLLPIHCLACIVFQRVSARLYVAYAPWVILGALAAGAGAGTCGSGGLAGWLAGWLAGVVGCGIGWQAGIIWLRERERDCSALAGQFGICLAGSFQHTSNRLPASGLVASSHPSLSPCRNSFHLSGCAAPPCTLQ